MPDDDTLEFVSPEVRQAIAEVVQPVYERFVLAVEDPLEKSLGLTVAHLVWLEVLQQFDLKREYTQVLAVLGLPDDRGAAIDQHLRIIDSKVKLGYLLIRLRELRRRWPEGSRGLRSLPKPATSWLPNDEGVEPVDPDSPPDGGPNHGKTASC